MRVVILITASALILSGCTIALQSNFAEKANNDLGVNPIIYHRADWIQGVYGYPPTWQTMFGLSKVSIIRGALVCDNDKVLFTTFNKQLQRYVSLFELSYDEITEVTVATKGGGRRLIIQEKKYFYTLEIATGAMIDKEKTDSFYNFISQRQKGLPTNVILETKKHEVERQKEVIESRYPDLPSKITSFLGKWEGAWENSEDWKFILTITDINLEVAQVNYESKAFQFCEEAKVIRGEKTKIEWMTYIRNIPGTSMSPYSLRAQYTFELQDDGTLRGTFDTQGPYGISRKVIMKRVPP
jgi:hypothetical protein